MNWAVLFKLDAGQLVISDLRTLEQALKEAETTAKQQRERIKLLKLLIKAAKPAK